jgi:ATP-binding cassette, subfamily B, bacterial HlyB/CyaB
VLHDVSFSVPAGQIVGIGGPSGSGKSTLAKLIQRLYVPESLARASRRVDLAMVDTAWLRRQLGIVLQENVLFNRLVRDNIALADPAMPTEQVIAAATLAGDMSSFWGCQKPMTPSSGRAAPVYRGVKNSG